MIVYSYLLTRVWFPKSLAEKAKKLAEESQQDEDTSSDDVDKSWKEKLFSRQGLQAIARSFFMEWKMVYKEIIFGFLVAGFISVFVPQWFWNSLFLQAGNDAPSFLAVLENAAIAPVVAFFTFIGSMGNVPLAAMLWSRNASFGGVMSFLGADLVAATVIYIHAKYYGWKYAGYVSLLLYVAMVAAGVTVHYLYSLTGMLPTARPTLDEMVRFKIDYTFWLNIVFLLLAGILVWLHSTNRESQSRQSEQ